MSEQKKPENWVLSKMIIRRLVAYYVKKPPDARSMDNHCPLFYITKLS